jgi:hypothetical protein
MTQDDRRLRDLLRIRQIFVPELIFRLHTMLFDSHWKIPEYVTLPFPNYRAYAGSSQKLETYPRAREYCSGLTISAVR